MQHMLSSLEIEVLVLTLSGKSPRDIAEQTNKSVSTVRKALARAKDKERIPRRRRAAA